MSEATITLSEVDTDALGAVMTIMHSAFDPIYGEAWNAAQCAAVMGGMGTWLLLAERDGAPVGFALTRAIAGEAELLLIAVAREAQHFGVGRALLARVIADCTQKSVETLFLEVRACNPAIYFYTAAGFNKVGERKNYYRGIDGKLYDAHSYSLSVKN